MSASTSGCWGLTKDKGQSELTRGNAFSGTGLKAL